MKQAFKLIQIITIILLFSSFDEPDKENADLTVEVKGLRNSTGTVLFALYNREDAFPDEHYQKYYKKLTGKIVNGVAIMTFENLPVGKYAVNILHDENNDGKIKKGLIFPKEGIGFSNYESVGIANRPDFSKASFNLLTDKKITIQIIYL